MAIIAGIGVEFRCRLLLLLQTSAMLAFSMMTATTIDAATLVGYRLAVAGALHAKPLNSKP